MYVEMYHLWRGTGISLKLEGRMCTVAQYLVLLYGCEKWILGAEAPRSTGVFDH